MADYYELLGVSKRATPDEIKKGYRKLAMKYHPDRNQGSKENDELFKQATEAYEVLRDSDKRTIYDQYGEQGLKRGAGGGDGFAGFDFSDALQVFMRDFGGFGGIEDIFGGRQQRGGSRGAAQGQAIKVRVHISLSDVAAGVTKSLRVAVLDSCERCSGSGSADGSVPAPCGTCGGSGEERQAQRTAFGQFISVVPCRRCRGEGRVIAEPCLNCHGEGRARSERPIEVEIPPGVTSENFITLRGEGNVGPRGGPRGDVLVLIEVDDDARFVRDGPSLRYELPITFTQAALGDETEVPTVEGTVRLTIPRGIQSGEVLRLRGHGLPELHGRGKGDQLVRIAVWTPQSLTDEQEEALSTLRDLEEPAPERRDRDSDRSIWSRVKEAFTQA
jgi:molecular chaperone DnaJ